MKTGIRALLVEDCDEHAELSMRSLRAIRHCSIDRVGTLGEARQAAANGVYDIVFLDLGLPDSSGIATLRAMRSSAWSTAVVVLTSDDSESIGIEAVAAGAQDYLPKFELDTAPIERVAWYAIKRQRLFSENVMLTEELRVNNAHLFRAREEAEQAHAVKSEFLANMSHEIRTPLTAILGFAEIAAECDGVLSDAEASEMIETINRNGRHLLGVVNDILDAAKIEAGGMTVDLAATNIADVAREAVEMVMHRARAKGIGLRLDIDEALPTPIECDPARFRQILLNLIGNAIKFTEAGEVCVTLDAQGRPDDLMVRVEVRDTGIGMTNEQLARITEFGAFTQADSSITRRFGGTGLGLRISQALAELLGGSITADSEPGRGSVFTLEIATRVVETETGPPVSEDRVVPGSLAGVRVLLADDSSDNRMLIAHHLERAGASVESVCDGREAVNRAVGEPVFDVILMDVQMPEMDGLEAIGRIRNAGVAIPILALSASTREEDRAACLAAGCDAYLSKPVARDALINAVVGAVAVRARAA